MRKADFARLCSVSPPMIAKYSKQGLIVMNGGGVDAAASLKALQHHLDENKRIDAIIALADGKPVPERRINETSFFDAPPPAPADAAPTDPRIVQLAEFQDARNRDRARREKIEADKAEVEFLQLTGGLVDANEVAREIENSVATFWSEIVRRERFEAEMISAKLGLDQPQSRGLRDLIHSRNMDLRNEYAATMRKLAAQTRSPVGDQDAGARVTAQRAGAGEARDEQ